MHMISVNISQAMISLAIDDFVFVFGSVKHFALPHLGDFGVESSMLDV